MTPVTACLQEKEGQTTALKSSCFLEFQSSGSSTPGASHSLPELFFKVFF